MATETKTPTTQVLLVCQGVCRTVDGKRGKQFIQATEQQFADAAKITQPTRVYALKAGIMHLAAPGQVFEVPATDTDCGAIYSGEAKYRGMWPNRDQVIEWRAADAVLRTKFDLEDRAEKDRKHDAVLECLEPLRKLYQSLPTMHRNHLIALVVQRLTRRG